MADDATYLYIYGYRSSYFEEKIFKYYHGHIGAGQVASFLKLDKEPI